MTTPQPTRQEIDASVASGQAALAKALRLSFAALKLALLVALIAVVLSGTRRVEEGTVAVRTLFGALSRSATGVADVLEPGGPYFWPPAPIGRVITIDTTLRSLELLDGNEFYIGLKEGEELLPVEGLTARPLLPGRDSYLLTSDGGIVHARFRIDYRVSPQDAHRFVQAFGVEPHSSSSPHATLPVDTHDTHEMHRTHETPDGRAERLLRSIARRAIVHTAARSSADRIVRGGLSRDELRDRLQALVDELETGLTIERVLVEQPTPPLAVLDAFQSVSLAEAERVRRIESARQRAEDVLGRTAGSSGSTLVEALDRLARARSSGDDALASEAEAELLRELDPERLTGEAAERLRAAVDLARAAEERVIAEREEFLELLASQRSAPDAWRRRHLQTAFESLLSGDVETFWLPSGETTDLELEIGRDPRIRAAREKARYESESPENRR